MTWFRPAGGFVSRFQSARRVRRRGNPASKRTGRQWTAESLEPRLVLAVVAAADSYVTAEDVGFASNLTAIVPRRSQGGWAVFDDIPLTGPNGNRYPDTNQSPVRWYERGYDATQPSYAAWEGATGFGLNAPFAYDVVNVLDPATQVDAPALTRNTVLARKTFSLTASQALVNQLTLDYVCDDGCIIYLNDVEVLRANLPAGAVEPNTFAVGGGLETAYTSVPLNLGVLGVALHADATNVLAVEVHNDDPLSSDIGFDVALSIGGGQGSTRGNDTTTAAVAPVNTYYWDGVASPATTVATSGPVLSADGETQVGTVTIAPSTGEFRYDPVASGPGANYSGDATFRYVLRDNDIAGVPSTATVTISIQAVNDAPVAADDVYALVRGTGPLAIGAAVGSIYISPSSAWYYSDQWVDQDVLNPEWKGPPSAGFNPASGGEAGWSTTPGTAPLGFGNGDEATTLLDSATEGTITYYFHNKFNVPGAVPSLLRLGLRADDAAVVYINGVEVARSPTLRYGHGFVTFADTGVDGLTEQRFVEYAIPTAGLNLQSMGNTIAVEVHQVSQTSSDMAFDLWLRSGLAGLLANDFDPDDPSSEFRVEVVDSSQFTPGVGTLTVQPDGALTFTPVDANLVGTFSFTYRVVDDGLPTPPAAASREATATIALLGAPHDRPPYAGNDRYRIDEDTMLEVIHAAPLIGFGDEWSYFDEMQNGQQSNPNAPAETYPFDSAADIDATPSVADEWHSPQFNTATSDPAIGVWKTGRGIFAGPIRGLFYAPGTTLLGGIGNAALPVGQNTVDTYLFRRTFTIDDAASVRQLRLPALIDDGAAIYVNGQLLGTVGLPDGPISSTTLADASGIEEAYVTYVVDLDNPTDLLHDGVNTIAVEVHQRDRTSSDAGFDLSLAIGPGAGVLTNDVDPDGDAFTSLRIVQYPFNGTVALNGDGTFRYTPDANFSGADGFEYVVVSGGRESAPATVRIDVDPIDDPVTAADDVYTAANDAMLVVDAAGGALANDFDEEPLVVLVNQSGGAVIEHAAGRFTWTNVSGGESDGSFVFEPTPGYVGGFVLAYTIENESGQRDTALLSINVEASTTPEDLDGDGDVDLADLATLVAHFGRSSATAADGDLNGDGRVGVADAVRLRNALVSAAPSAAVPSAAAVVRAAGRSMAGHSAAALVNTAIADAAIADGASASLAAQSRRGRVLREAASDTLGGVPKVDASDSIGADTKTRLRARRARLR